MASASVSAPKGGEAPNISGPVSGARVTESYLRLAVREMYFWAWPMMNVCGRRSAFENVPKPGLLGGLLPVAPLNYCAMLHDYIDPAERAVACPNQDVVYGQALLALDQSPAVLQVPDFGDRFWIYQVVDLRTDGFANVGKMYGTKPGFYLVAGPNWSDEIPAGIAQAFRCSTNTAMIFPRVFQNDTAEDKAAVKSVIEGINIYPLADYDGNVKRVDWTQLPIFPSPVGGSGETKWVDPAKFFEQLQAVLNNAPPLSGEGARYAIAQSLIEIASRDEKLRTAMIDEVTKAEKDAISPLLQFSNWGVPLPYNWTTEVNGASFGVDYFARTAVAKSNIFVNKPSETTYFYQDLDSDGVRLNGSYRYTVTFVKGALPPVRGFWSLTLYNAEHFFAPNSIQRYSVGTKNAALHQGADGSLTIYVQADEPNDPVKRANWLPSPSAGDFSLYVRAYWPQSAITDGSWTPPPVQKVT
jgi:hypothetical protein